MAGDSGEYQQKGGTHHGHHHRQNSSTARAAVAALETARRADLADKAPLDYALIHDMTARRDDLRWRIGSVCWPTYGR